MTDWSKYVAKSPRSEAKRLAAKGRNGDSILMHISPEELAIAKATGGVTTNPETGLPEGFLLIGSLLAGLASAAASAAAVAAPVVGAIGSGLGAVGGALGGLGSLAASGAGALGTALGMGGAAAPAAAGAGAGAGGIGASLGGLTAAAAPGAGVLSGAGAGVLAPTAASTAAPALAGGVAYPGLASATGMISPEAIMAANPAIPPSFFSPAAAPSSQLALTPEAASLIGSAPGDVVIPGTPSFGGIASAPASVPTGGGMMSSGLSSIGRGIGAVGKYAMDHPMQSLMGLYGVGMLADNLSNKDDVGPEEEEQYDFESTPEYQKTRNAEYNTSYPDANYYKSGTTGWDYFRSRR